MADPPDVTVVIPTRNRWPQLRQTLRAALGQEGVRLEVVVVDDESTDETCRGLSTIPDPRLRVVRHDVRQDVASARNRGIREARSEWIAFLDDDDFWSPRKLRLQLAAARLQRASWVYGAAAVLDERRRVVSTMNCPGSENLLQLLLSTNVMPNGTSNVMVGTELLRTLGGFDERLPQLCDWDLWIRLATGHRPAVQPEVLVVYRARQDNMLLEEGRVDIMAELEVLTEKHRSAREHYGVAVDQAAFAQFLAYGYRRAGRRGRAAESLLRSAVKYRSIENAMRALMALLGEGPSAMVARSVKRSKPIDVPWLADYM